MIRDQIKEEYFDWLLDMVCKNRYSGRTSFRKLLTLLHSIEFRYTMRKDANRAYDGIDLRRRFASNFACMEEADQYLDGPCSVLEMMVALAIRCEEDMMDNPKYGDRTCQWFWGMIVSLGLGDMFDDNFDEERAIFVIDRFLDRKYEPNGKGGLFTVRNCRRDLRRLEIWTQLCLYLDNLV